MTKTRKQHPLLSCVCLLLLLAVCITILPRAYTCFYEAAYPRHYSDAVEQAAKDTGIPSSLIYAVIHTESNFDPNAISSANAKGLMQLTDETFRWALQREGTDKDAPADLFDPAVNIRYGGYVLTLLREQFSDTNTMLAAYNAGQGRVKDWLADPLYSSDGITLKTIPIEETDQYIKRVNAAREQYQKLYNLD